VDSRRGGDLDQLDLSQIHPSERAFTSRLIYEHLHPASFLDLVNARSVQMSKLLWTVREHRDLPAQIWEQFRAKPRAAGFSPSALARLIRRYLIHGFDDGEAERRDPDSP
jgi:hypothetical protein